MKRLAVVGLVLVASCATARPITLSDGRSGYLVTCGKNYQSVADCRSEARKACGGNYSEVTKDEDYLEIVCEAPGR